MGQTLYRNNNNNNNFIYTVNYPISDTAGIADGIINSINKVIIVIIIMTSRETIAFSAPVFWIVCDST